MKRFLRTWMLAIAIVAGAALYFAWMAMPFGARLLPSALGAVKALQPVLIFTMLFVTFCKVDPHHLVPRRWHAVHLVVQCGAFVALAALLRAFPALVPAPVVEAAMLCFICPTATAAVVVTGKLGGDIEGLTTYTILINLAVALSVPAVVPWVAPHPELDFFTSFFLIMGRIFPMLILPFFAALLVRFLFKGMHRRILGLKDFAFYLWAVSLALAITVSTHALMTTRAAVGTLLAIGAVSLGACIVQFALGRSIGRSQGNPIAGGQALGQKNTVFLIWAGYTFFDPVSSIAGGFYSVWHNLWNSYQLSRAAASGG